MKTIQRISILFLILICLNTYAQDYSKISTDSMKTKILKNLNDKKKDYHFDYTDKKMGLKILRIKDFEAIYFDNYDLIFKTKKGLVFSANLDQKISFSSHIDLPDLSSYDWHHLNIGDSLCISLNNDKEEKLEVTYRLFLSLNNLRLSEIVEKKLAAFQEIATGYKTLAEKPKITEEQRKYIVQANSKNEKKEYEEALELYKKAIDVNPTSFPSAYYNMALIAAQIKDYRYAIFNMKKYLMLVPEAEDARAAQDKIYEWEAEIKK